MVPYVGMAIGGVMLGVATASVIRHARGRYCVCASNGDRRLPCCAYTGH